tara:strand:+ start:858 stop:1235 length:378 start_codon:yes stop_codon:yes gene_type:complete
MKALTASKIIPERKQELIKLDDLFDLPNRSDESYLEYLGNVYKDMDNRGMEHPILVIRKNDYWNRLPWTGTDTQLGVVTGSNRFRYAVDRGYTHIEGIICTNRGDWFNLWESTFYRVKLDLTNGS